MEMPKPPPLPPPLPPPAPPAPPKPAAKKLQESDKKLDVRIGQAKRSTTSGRSRSTSRSGKQSLSIGDNQGMTL